MKCKHLQMEVNFVAWTIMKLKTHCIRSKTWFKVPDKNKIELDITMLCCPLFPFYEYPNQCRYWTKTPSSSQVSGLVIFTFAVRDGNFQQGLHNILLFGEHVTELVHLALQICRGVARVKELSLYLRQLADCLFGALLKQININRCSNTANLTQDYLRLLKKRLC